MKKMKPEHESNPTAEKMPVLFVGHGSPMNAIEDNVFTKNWDKIGKMIPTPKGILMISAHWYTKGTKVYDTKKPEMKYDMFGFPKELYEVTYPVKGDPKLAKRVIELCKKEVLPDNSWGYDHGAWSVLKHMYPDANIPVVQLSVDAHRDGLTHFHIGQSLRQLREEGILIIGSGNVVHNLSKLDWNRSDGFSWANVFNDYVREAIVARDHESLIHYQNAGESSGLAFEIPDHYYPLLTVVGATDTEDEISVFNDVCVHGSLSMTGYLFESPVPYKIIRN